MFVGNYESINVNALSPSQKILKRSFDISFSFLGLLVFGWLILLAAILATVDTRRSGFFRQERVGKNGKIFKVLKLRSMREVEGITTSVTTKDDPRITAFGMLLRRTKLDELPQLINVLIGDMSIVGPRPDVPGYADKLQGENKIILSIRPGITGPASIKYRNEEALLAEQEDPESYNRNIIFKDKVRVNRDYIENYSFVKDLRYIWETVFK